MDNKTVNIKSLKLKKSILWYVIYAIILIGIISLFIFRHFHVQTFEQQYLANTNEIVSRYGLHDVNISLNYQKEYNNSSSDGRSYIIELTSDTFGKLDKGKQYEIIDLIFKINVPKSNFIISNVTAYSNQDIYKISSNNHDILVKNSKDYYNYKSKEIVKDVPKPDLPKTSNYSHTPSYTQTPTDKEKISAWSITTHIVEEQLKSPSSAKFPPYSRDMSIKKDGNNYQVVSYVEAENSFGAKIRTAFIAEFEMTQSGYKSATVAFVE